MSETDPTSPEARLEGARKQLRHARETLADEEVAGPAEEMRQGARVQSVTDALAATDAALDIVRGEREALQAAMEAQR